MHRQIGALRASAARRRAYWKTLREIERMPRDVALDLGICPGDARRLAYDAVYGQ